MGPAVTTVEQLLEHAGWARRLARSLVGDAEADDLLQETWLEALRRRPHADRPIRAWLQRVLLTRGMNRRRDVSRRDARHDAAARLTADDAAASPDELLGRLEVQRLLAEAVVALPEPLRHIVLLRYYEELSSTEIAALIGQPAGSVRRHLKDALAQIRTALDRAHSGRRALWVGALAPVPAPQRTVSGAPAATIAALVGVAGVVTLIAAPRDRERGHAAALASAPISQGRQPRPTPPAPTATTSRSTLACQAELASLATRLAQAEAQRRSRLKTIPLYEEGAPNPAARLALAPIVDRIMKPFAPAATHSLECRTWICRVHVVQPAGSSAPWKEALRHDAELQHHMRGGSLIREAAITDAITAAPLEQASFYLRLADPSGRPLPLEARAAPPYLPPSPPPTSPADCLAALAATRSRLTELAAILPPPTPADQLHAAGTLDPEATARARAIVERALGGGAPAYAPEVDCRGRACRVVVPGRMLGQSGRDWHARLLRDPDFVRLRSDQPMAIGAAGLFFTLRAP